MRDRIKQLEPLSKNLSGLSYVLLIYALLSLFYHLLEYFVRGTIPVSQLLEDAVLFSAMFIFFMALVKKNPFFVSLLFNKIALAVVITSSAIAMGYGTFFSEDIFDVYIGIFLVLIVMFFLCLRYSIKKSKKTMKNI